MDTQTVYSKYKNLSFLAQYRTWAEIDVAALKSNYKVLSEKVKHDSPDCKCICVVKADAYGHSANICVPALIECGADFFAVSCIEEALGVKSIADSLGKEVRILILGYTLPSEADLLIKNNITQAVFSLDYALELDSSISNMIKSGCLEANSKLRAHIKLDTGMNRIGFRTVKSQIDTSVDEIERICKLPNISVKGIFTHFARADEEDSTMTEMQAARYTETVEKLQSRGISFEEKHICNSAGSVKFKNYHFDYVRLGILLYGLMPSEEVGNCGLTPVMRLKTTVSHIHTIDADETVSYGGHFRAKESRKIATLPIGYADGFVRAATGGKVTINGQDATIVGNICMDQCMVDITDLKDVSVGDTVTVYGDTPDNIERFAKLARTINYELVCLVSGRVPRIVI